MDNKFNNINEGMFSTIDQIRKDSKDVRDFVKKVFSDRDFKKMKDDKEFIKYLKSIYEGTILDEEQIKFSNRINSGTIVTTITNEDTLNEISRLSMGIAGLTGTRGSAVEKFIKDYNLNDKELFKFLKKGKLKDRLDFATALSGRPGNKYQGDFVGAFGEGVEESVNEGTDIYIKNKIQITKFSGGKDGKLVQINAPKVQNSGDHIIMKIDDFKKMLKNSSKLLKQVQESVNEAKFGYKDSTASYITKHKNEFKLAKKLNKGNELKFYDELEKLESKLRRPKYMVFLSNSLRGFKVDMYKDSKIKNKQEAEEALFLLSK